jgi:hypothetical protein
VLASRHLALKAIPESYLNFASHLQPGDIVLTFNYDTLLENALDAVGKSYRLFSSHYATIDRGSGVVRPETEVSIFKVHGSIDWFNKESLEYWKVDTRTLDLKPVVHGPSFDEELKGIYRCGNFSEAYAAGRMFRATPQLLAPSPIKFAYAPRLTGFFNGLNSAGVLNFGMAIVGYSLPKHDNYAQQILYTLVTNYQNQYWDKPAFSRPKTPLVIVDLLPSRRRENQFRDRYRFVDWEKARLYPEGFSSNSVEAIFAEPASP